MASNLVAGVAYLSLAGQRRALAGEFAYQVSGFTREAKTGQDGPHGFKQKFMYGNVTGKFRDVGTELLTDLGAVTDETIFVELANGKTVTARNAFWSGDPPKADAEEAEIEFKFESPDVTDALAA